MRPREHARPPKPPPEMSKAAGKIFLYSRLIITDFLVLSQSMIQIHVRRTLTMVMELRSKIRTTKLTLKAGKVEFFSSYLHHNDTRSIFISFFICRTQVQASGDFEEQEESHYDMVVQAKNAMLALFDEMETEAR